MTPYTVTIIYNPQSTGPSEQLARELEAQLRAAAPELTVSCRATEHAGHAEELAYDLARAAARPLVISASGDGGYHEVINGLLRAQRHGAHPVAGLLPAGNANDHYANLHHDDVVADILAGHEQAIDLLKLTATSHGQPLERYAHSYIGLGLTPQVGRELNQTKLNRFNEIWIVLKTLVRLRAVHLVADGHPRRYDSLIFTNVNRMSKVLSLSDQAAPDDGTFEIIAFHRQHRLKLISTLLKATTVGLGGGQRARQYNFETTKTPTLIQLDGEIQTLDAHTTAAITLEPAILHCII